MRDGVDVPGRALRLVVFERVPWPRPDILHRERRVHLSGGDPKGYDDSKARLRLRQAFGRLVRSATRPRRVRAARPPHAQPAAVRLPPGRRGPPGRPGRGGGGDRARSWRRRRRRSPFRRPLDITDPCFARSEERLGSGSWQRSRGSHARPHRPGPARGAGLHHGAGRRRRWRHHRPRDRRHGRAGADAAGVPGLQQRAAGGRDRGRPSGCSRRTRGWPMPGS